MGKRTREDTPFRLWLGKYKLKPQQGAISHLLGWQKLVNLRKPSIGEDVGKQELISY